MSATGAENSEGEVVVTDGPGETVTVPPPDDDAPDEGTREEKTPAERPENRKARRENKMREEREGRETAERAARESNERWMQAQRETAELRGYVASLAQQQRQPDPAAALNEKVAKLRQEAMAHLERSAVASRAGDRATAERELAAHYEKIEDATMERYDARQRPELDQRFQEVRGNIPSPEIITARENIIAEFPWIRSDPEARAMVDVKFEALKAAGRPGTFDTIREAAALIAKRLGIGGRQAPTQANRQRLQGVPSGEGSGGGDGNVQIPMGAPEKKLAHLSFPGLEAKEAEKAWAKSMAEAKRRNEW